MSDWHKYLDATGSLGTDTLLGWVVMWSVEDFDPGITHRALEKLFEDLDLNKSLMPGSPKKLDAFRKATTEFKREIEQPDGTVASYFARDVKSAGEFIQRHIVREIRDPRTRELTYTKAIECVFYKPTQQGPKRLVNADSARVRYNAWPQGYPKSERHVVDQMVDDLRNRQAVLETHVDSQRIRAVIRDYIKYLDAVQLKSSVYFIPKDNADELQRLLEFTRALPGRCRMHLVPLVDLDDMREMVIEAFQEESTAGFNRIVEACAEIKNSPKGVTPASYVSLKAEFEEISNKAHSYAKRMDTTRHLAEGAQQLALMCLVDLSRRMVDRDVVVLQGASA